MKNRVIILAIAMITLLSLLAGCSSNIAATVNGTEITKDQLEKNFNYQQKMAQVNQGPAPTEEETLEGLIGQELILQKAKELEINIEDEKIEEIIADYKDTEDFKKFLEQVGIDLDFYKKLVKIQLIISEFRDEIEDSTDEEVDKYIAENEMVKDYLVEIRARHILIGTEDQSEEVLNKAKKEAEAILDELKNGADFAELAKEKSTGPSGEKGGDLDFFRKGDMVPEFDEAVFDLEVGEISDLVRTQYGYHIIKLEEIRDLSEEEMEVVREEIKNVVKDEKLKEQIDSWREEADIEIIK